MVFDNMSSFSPQTQIDFPVIHTLLLLLARTLWGLVASRESLHFQPGVGGVGSIKPTEILNLTY